MSPEEKPEEQPLKIPEWLKRVGENTVVGSIMLLVFFVFIQPLSDQVSKVNERLYSIEKKTEVLITIGNEKISQLESQQAKLIGQREADQDRIREMEQRIYRIEINKAEK